MVPGLQPLTERFFIMSNVTTYQDLLDNDHAALVAECNARYDAPKARRKYTPRSDADMLREYEAQLAATSINMINFSGNRWS